MESLESPISLKKNAPSARFSPNIPFKDLWSASRLGSVSEVDSALIVLKKNGGNVDSRNACGVTPLHIAVWRNHVPIVKRLLAAGADPDTRDGESGWSSLHRAIHFGHFVVASILMKAGASLTVEDSKCRTPVDLFSGPVSQVISGNPDSVATEVFSWGSGTNYQLGTGNAHIQKLPGKVDALHGSYIKIIAASKFHSVAVGSGGELYTWGFGRGGRLGHPDFDVHSGQAAVITPRLVASGLGFRRVKAVAAAKHHTVIATESGEVFTWGSNREGQLGYTSVDNQPTPRRVSYLKARVVAIAAANKHTAAVADSGEIFTWGCNKKGQLGYGTSNSASNYSPRMVECLKGKVFRGVSAAKYHTVVLSVESEVFTWGHRFVNPRRVIISRSLKKCGSALLKFHRMERIQVISVAAGTTHSCALTDDGAIFYWASSDPDLRCEQVCSPPGRNFGGISCGKYWTAAVTTTGDVYIWDGKKCKHEGHPVLTRLPGIKHVTSACVGETHLLAVCSLYHPAYRPMMESNKPVAFPKINDELYDLDDELPFSDFQPVQNKNVFCKPVPTLKSLCERVVAEILVEPRNALQLLEIADSLEAENLRKHCEDLVIRNLDYVFVISAQAISCASLEVLARLEKSFGARSSEPWCYRRFPTSTATFPLVIYGEEDRVSEAGNPVPIYNRKCALKDHQDFAGKSFLQGKIDTDHTVSKQLRALRKKLQQIDMLLSKQNCGYALDEQQMEKLQTRSSLEGALAELGFPHERDPKCSFSGLIDGKGNKKLNSLKKQRRKSLPMGAQTQGFSLISEISEEKNSINRFPNEDNLILNKAKEITAIETFIESEINEDRLIKNPSIIALGSNISMSIIPTQKKKNKKKGGLSLFLSGALDTAPPQIVPPPKPKVVGPAWGGARIEKGSTSLLDIQNEQSRIKEACAKLNGTREVPAVVAEPGILLLSSFLPGECSSPIAVKSGKLSPVFEGDSTPPWSTSKTSPIFRPSLKSIQKQQEKMPQSVSHSPKTSPSGFFIAPSDSGNAVAHSRWFKPEAEAPSSIRSIQIEEKAMKDLRRFYSNVRLLKTHPQPF